AGMEVDAVDRVRYYLGSHRPSSPQIALLKNGRVVKLWQRQDIQDRDASVLAHSLSNAFDKFC
ncbi:MAG: BrxA/BrxB family bacilliredoxin, partial [Deltaproteobacteria bacterium]|nr:BrxA/BrxB family bacilliredoxin [Deltaproteobacteria bacterium]